MIVNWYSKFLPIYHKHDAFVVALHACIGTCSGCVRRGHTSTCMWHHPPAVLMPLDPKMVMTGGAEQGSLAIGNPASAGSVP